MRARAVGGLEPDEKEQAELVELWHLSRTALASSANAPGFLATSRTDRIRWAVDEFCKAHPSVARKWPYVWAVDNLGLLVRRS